MKVAIEEPGRWERVLSVEVPAEDISEELDAIYRELAGRVDLPGFRRGKAPRHVIKARFGKSIEYEILERVIPRAYHAALAENRLVPVSEPEFDRVAYEESAPLSFQARVKVGPEVIPTGYSGMTLVLEVPPVQEAHVESNLESIRERHADYVPVEREAIDTDLVLVDYAPLNAEGQPAETWTRGFPIAVGDDSLVPEFARAVRGARAGEVRDAVVEQRHAEGHDEFEGAHTHVARFRLALTEVRERRLPPLDDELAKKVEAKSGDTATAYESLESLKDEIRKRLAIVEEARARERMAAGAVERLLSAHPFDVPDFLVDQLLEGVEARAEDADPVIIGDRDAKTKALRQELRPEAAKRVRRSLLLTAIARLEKIAVAQEDVDREITRIARREGRGAEDVRKAILEADVMGGLRERLLEERVVRYILDHAEIERGSPAA